MRRFPAIASVLLAASGVFDVAHGNTLHAQTARNSTMGTLRTDTRPPSRADARSTARSAASAEALRRSYLRLEANDSTGAIAVLREAAAKDANNAQLWYRYGELLAERTRHAWRRGVMPAGVPNMIIAAESSLARAARLEPDSAQYAVAHGKLLFGVGIFGITQATQVQRDVVDRFEARNDTASMATAADQVGIMMWRRYEPHIGKSAPGEVQEFIGAGSAKALAQHARESTRVPRLPFGWGLYREAVDYFRYARALAPSVELYLRHEAMALAELNRWDELAALGRERVASHPEQPWGWLIQALGEYRGGKRAPVMAWFDSGFQRLPELDRTRLASVRPLMTWKQQKWYDTLDTETQKAAQELFFRDVRPSRLSSTNPLLVEFLARVVYAELRFSDEEAKMSGANSDKGTVYIRYGPPDHIQQGVAYQEGVRLPSQTTSISGTTQASPNRELGSDYTQTWTYFAPGLMFTFRQTRLFGTAYFTWQSKEFYEDWVPERPATWANLPLFRNRVDFLSSQVVRFRRNADSVDLAIVAAFRPAQLIAGSPLDSTDITHGVVLLDPGGHELHRVVRTHRSNIRDSNVVLPVVYVVSAHDRPQAVHVEAIVPDLQRLASGITNIEPLRSPSFTTSDLLITGGVREPASLDRARWRDFQIQWLAGNAIRQGAPLTLLWETYDPAVSEGRAHVEIDVRVERLVGRDPVAIAARVIAGAREALTGAPNTNRVSITYKREFAPQRDNVDFLTLDAGALSPGAYRVTLTVTDLISGQKSIRVQPMTVMR